MWNTLLICGSLIVTGLVLAPQHAQAQRQRRDENKQDDQEPAPLPTDRRLLALHRTFVSQAEKLALEYERDKDLDKAKAVYGEILKLVPSYQPAQAKLAAIEQHLATAQRTVVKVDADKGLVDTGIIVLAGKPITINARGTWTFNFTAELTADGMKIPDELREYNLGCLIGYVDTGENRGDPPKPFVIGQSKSWVPPQTGKLFVQMYDNFAKDNEGSLQLEVLGTFDER